MQRALQIIIPLILASALLAGCTNKEAVCPDGAHRFWTKFRDAVLKNDLNAVADMTEFPLVIHRSGDEREILLSRQEFIKYYPQLLDAPLGRLYPPMTPAPASMKALVHVVSMPDGPVCKELPGQFDVGHWVFFLRSEGWRLGAVYIPAFPSSMNHIPLQPHPLAKD